MKAPPSQARIDGAADTQSAVDHAGPGAGTIGAASSLPASPGGEEQERGSQPRCRCPSQIGARRTSPGQRDARRSRARYPPPAAGAPTDRRSSWLSRSCLRSRALMQLDALIAADRPRSTAPSTGTVVLAEERGRRSFRRQHHRRSPARRRRAALARRPASTTPWNSLDVRDRVFVRSQRGLVQRRHAPGPGAGTCATSASTVSLGDAHAGTRVSASRSRPPYVLARPARTSPRSSRTGRRRRRSPRPRPQRGSRPRASRRFASGNPTQPSDAEKPGPLAGPGFGLGCRASLDAAG